MTAAASRVRGGEGAGHPALQRCRTLRLGAASAMARLQTCALLAAGWAEAQVQLDGRWNMTISTPGRAAAAARLHAVMTDGAEDLIYLFAGAPGPAPVGDVPPQLQELLLFPPLVPLRKRPRGFQGLRYGEWLGLVTPEAPPIAGHDSLRTAPDDQERGSCPEDFEEAASDCEEEDDVDSDGDVSFGGDAGGERSP